MDIVKIKDTLKKLAIAVRQDHPRINHGGCCVYAHLITKKLNDIGVRANGFVVTFCQRPGSVAKARDNVSEHHRLHAWDRYGVRFDHVGVELFLNKERFHYDAEGLYVAAPKFHRHKVLRGRLPCDVLETLATKGDTWNAAYDRRQTPSLKKLVNAHFKELMV